MHQFGRALTREVTELSKELVCACDRVRGNDPESLHDLRIAIRRIRSVLAPLQPLPQFEALHKPMRKFKKLATLTNSLRDREVMLDLIASLAPQPGIDLSAWCLAHEQRQTSAMLQLELALKQKPLEHSAKLVAKAFRRGVKKSRRIQLTNQLKARGSSLRDRLVETLGKKHDILGDLRLWHSVRLDCKKLRYLLEAYPAGHASNTSDLIPLLRQAQATLGRLRDIKLLEDALHADAVVLSGLQLGLKSEKETRLRQASQSIDALSERLLL